MKTKVLSILLAAALLLTACQTQPSETGTVLGPPSEVQEPQGTPAMETENLEKLCKVWGYTKYMHPAFLLGKKDWDQELLALIPQVQEAESAEAVNELLHTWFVSLGEIDYESRVPFPAWVSAKEDEKMAVTDTSWTKDASYLGEALAADFAQFPEVLPKVDRSKAPVKLTRDFFATYERAEDFFVNEGALNLSYKDPGFRLVGLFRLWNAIEYYFPYTDTLEQDWEDTLRTYIPRMLAETDLKSYQRTIASLACALRDPHVEVYQRSDEYGREPLYQRIRGPYPFPVPVAAAEGKLVVSGTAEDCPLEPGDVLVSINGEDIDTIIEECKQYVCYPREDSVLNRMRDIITSSRENIQVTVLRNGEEEAFSVTAAWKFPEEGPESAYEIIEDNIGLINPSLCTSQSTDAMMEALRGTDGLIVDLRQYPGEDGGGLYGCAQYLGVQNAPFLTLAAPSIAVPGTYLKETFTPVGLSSATGIAQYRYRYEKPIVVLMDSLGTQSNAEAAVQMFRLAENTVTMGECSAGAGGVIVYLDLPGDLVVRFSNMWWGKPDGEEWYLTGIAPDVPVPRTIQGVKEGRDEVMEAAIEYIRSKS